MDLPHQETVEEVRVAIGPRYSSRTPFDRRKCPSRCPRSLLQSSRNRMVVVLPSVPRQDYPSIFDRFRLGSNTPTLHGSRHHTVHLASDKLLQAPRRKPPHFSSHGLGSAHHLFAWLVDVRAIGIIVPRRDVNRTDLPPPAGLALASVLVPTLDGNIDPGFLERPLAPILPTLFHRVRGASTWRGPGKARCGHGSLRRVGSLTHCGPAQVRGHDGIDLHDVLFPPHGHRHDFGEHISTSDRVARARVVRLAMGHGVDAIVGLGFSRYAGPKGDFCSRICPGAPATGKNAHQWRGLPVQPV